MSTLPKNIIFCFDGTGQAPEDAIQDTDTPEDDPDINGLSNVAKLHLLLGGDFDREDHSNRFYDMPGQVSFYYAGVGTQGGALMRLLESLFGKSDPESIAWLALEDLRKTFKPNDKVFAIGHSRGSAIARRFCAIVSKEPDLSSVAIEMLVASDTVASIGTPDFSQRRRPSPEVVFENYGIAPNIVQALHCVSIDDRRNAFQPTLMNFEPRVTEIWFAGGHGDVGGGFYNDGLSDVVLQFILDEFARRSVGLQVLSPSNVKLNEISKATKEVVIEPDDIDIKPNALGILHGQRRFPGRKNRKVVVLVNDEIAETGLPIVHHSVAERIKGDRKYRPRNLEDTVHQILNADGSLSLFDSLNDHLGPKKHFLFSRK